MFEHSWHSLFVPSNNADEIASVLSDALVALSYRRYDPFPGGTGLSFGWKRQIRHFVAPPAAQWTRVLGEPDTEALQIVAAALDVPVLHVWLDGDRSGVAVYVAGGVTAGLNALGEWLRPDRRPEDLARALDGSAPAPVLHDESPQVLAVPLPPDIQQMAEQVNPKEAEKMMARLTKTVFGKLEGEAAQAGSDARSMLDGGSPWNTDAGRRLRAVMDCLTLPDDWRVPNHADVREAYQVARTRRHNPDALCLPGDDEALKLVPNVLDYKQIYAGLR
jgi:hypothetical protein